MAAILFVDVVKYSGLPDHLQKQVAQGLNEECVKYLLPAFRHQRMSVLKDTVVAAMPTGDGAVICLEETPDIPNPGLFLLDLAFVLQNWGRDYGRNVSPPLEIKFRIGLHSGKLLSIEDVNLQRNFCGRDINIAQRIMDCGEADHILCSVDARDKHFRALPLSYSSVKFTPLAPYYKIKHGEEIRLCNITKGDKAHLENGRLDPPRVQWKYHILPYKKVDLLDFFKDCHHLIIVGITNDQIAPALRDALQLGPNGSILKVLERLDVYYASEDLFDYIPQKEKPNPIADAVDGNPNRDRQTLMDEQARSKAIVCGLKHSDPSKPLKINVRSYRVFPMASIVAGDVKKDCGVIQATHYIWGRMAGSCPTMVLRPQSLEEVYNLYAEYLEFLEVNSTPWECP